MFFLSLSTPQGLELRSHELAARRLAQRDEELVSAREDASRFAALEAAQRVVSAEVEQLLAEREALHDSRNAALREAAELASRHLALREDARSLRV